MARILIVEDNDDLRECLGMMLAQCGHDVAVAENGQVALEIFLASQFDAIITDSDMPLLNGRQLIEKVRTAGSEIPIILVSGKPFSQEEVRAWGATEFIQKPYEKICRILGELL